MASLGFSELLISMIQAFGAARPTSFGLGELLEALEQAIADFAQFQGGHGGGLTYLYTDLHAALADIIGQVTGTDHKIGLIGDSTTFGTAADTGYGSTITLSKLLQSYGAPAALGLVIPWDPTSPSADPRYSLGSGWSASAGGPSQSSWGGLGTSFSGTVGAGTLTFTPDTGEANGPHYDTFDVYYLQDGGGTFNANIDGGTDTPVTTTGVPGIGVVTLTASSPSNIHSVRIHNISTATVYIIGIEPSNAGFQRFRVANLGAYGSTTTEWVRTAAGASGPLAAIAKYAADIWFIGLGVNDAGSGVPVATFLANLKTIVAQCQLSGTVVIVSPVPSSPSDGNYLANEALYTNALPNFCVANGCAFFDLFTAWGGYGGGYAAMNAAGFYAATSAQLHPSTLGYSDIGRGQLAAILGA